MRLRRLRTTMSSRDPEEAHRASTPLGLFLGLIAVEFVVERRAAADGRLV